MQRYLVLCPHVRMRGSVLYDQPHTELHLKQAVIRAHRRARGFFVKIPLKILSARLRLEPAQAKRLRFAASKLLPQR